MSYMTFKVNGMSCQSCANSVEASLNKNPNINKAEVSIATGKASVDYNEKLMTTKEIFKIVKNAGYTPVEEESTVKEVFDKELFYLIFSIALTGPLVLPMFLPVSLPQKSEFILASIVQFVMGARFYKATLRSIKSLNLGMDTLVAIGTSAAYFLSIYLMLKGESHLYFESSAMIITFILLGKYLEEKAKKKTQALFETLEKLKPKVALLLVDEEEVMTPISKIKEGDLIFVKAGDIIPLDGIILKGESHINESMVTGESIAVSKREGDKVIGGTINEDGPLRIKVLAVGENTFLNQMISYVSLAYEKKTPVQKLVDKISFYFVPIVIFISLVTFVAWFFISSDLELSIINAVSVLVIACPCALGLATPAAIMVGSGLAAKNGILIRDSEAFEKSNTLKIVALDKTGTLTKGKPKLVHLEIFNKANLSILKSLQINSEHSLAKATLQHEEIEKRESVPLQNIKTHPGLGVSGFYEGKEFFVGNKTLLKEKNLEAFKNLMAFENHLTHSYFFSKNELFAVLNYEDEIKEGATQTISDLKEMGLTPVMITGDTKGSAENIANQLKIDRFYYEVLPKDKAEVIKDLKKTAPVLMVGDGINDALSLTEADVGIAMGEGSDVAKNSAGLTLMKGEPKLIVAAIKISRATYKKIKENLFWAFFYNIIGIPLAALGFLSPMIAGLAMSFSSVSVLLNALHLKRFKP